MANYLDTTGLTALWGKIKAWANAQFTTAKLVITGYSKPSAGGSLSATDTINQALGKLEKGIEGAASSVASHNHDDRYYTETEADGRFAPKSHAHTVGQIEDADGKGLNDIIEEITDDIADKANNTDVVHKTGDETIGGQKTFSAPLNGSAYITTPNIKMSGNITMNQHQLDGLSTPTTEGNAATKGYVDGKITSVNGQITTMGQAISNIQSSIASGLVFKGTIGSGGTVVGLPTSGYKVGNCYIVKTAGTYAGEVCEVGDMIVCTGVSGSTVTWNVIQNNLDLHPIATATIDALN